MLHEPLNQSIYKYFELLSYIYKEVNITTNYLYKKVFILLILILDSYIFFKMSKNLYIMIIMNHCFLCIFNNNNNFKLFKKKKKLGPLST